MSIKFTDDLEKLKKNLHLIINDLNEEDVRLFFKLNNFEEDEGLSYLSLRYRFRQLIDFAQRDVIHASDVYGRTFDPDLSSRLTYIYICSMCGQKNKTTNARISPVCERKKNN